MAHFFCIFIFLNLIMIGRNSKKIKSNLRLRMFVVFLVFSFLFWMLIKLSKIYSSEVTFDIEYINLPSGKVFQSSLISTVNASLRSNGFSIIKHKFNVKKLKFDVSNLAFKSGRKYYYLPNNHLTELKLQLDDETHIERIAQDTIFLNLGLKMVKRVPVELDVNIEFKLGYNFVDAIKIVPDSVDIMGPDVVLDTIYKILTSPIELLEVSNTINSTVDLIKFKNLGLTYSSSEINLVADVDKFTEGSLTVPFEILNLPVKYSITTFPKEVEVIYIVGLSNFSKINKENMRVLCDFKKSRDNKLNYLIPKLKQQSPLISSVRFVPSKIEYLIEK